MELANLTPIKKSLTPSSTLPSFPVARALHLHFFACVHEFLVSVNNWDSERGSCFVTFDPPSPLLTVPNPSQYSFAPHCVVLGDRFAQTPVTPVSTQTSPLPAPQSPPTVTWAWSSFPPCLARFCSTRSPPCLCHGTGPPVVVHNSTNQGSEKRVQDGWGHDVQH